MASCLTLENSISGIIPIGTMIVSDAGKARIYDEKTDNIENVIGVAYGYTNTSGRAWNLGDGPVFYTSPNDYFLWNEDLTIQLDSDNQPIPDPNYVGFNPFSQPDNYTFILYKGFGAVVKPYSSLPSRWVVLEEKTDYSWVLIR